MVANNLGTATGSVQINTSSLKNADIALRSAGTSLINIGVQAGRAFGAVIGAAAAFEKEMDFVQAITNATSEEMTALEDAAKDLAKNSIFGPIVLAEAFTELVKAGATAEQVINGVGEASVNLAQAADIEIPFAGENLINILNTFKLGSEDAVYVTDLLAGAANASSVEVSDLVNTLRYAGPVAQAVGIDIEDLNLAMTALGKIGLKGSIAGTSLRMTMLRLAKPTAQGQKALEKLGFAIGENGAAKEFQTANGELKSLQEIFSLLGDAAGGLSTVDQTAAFNDIFGLRAVPSALELMSLTEERWAELNAEIQRTTAADVAAQRIDNLDGSIKRLKATIEAVMVDAGGPFQTMLKDWVDAAREIIIWFDELPTPIKNFIVGSIGVIAVLSIMAGAFLLTIGNIVRMVRVMGEIINAFALFRGAAATAVAANTAVGASGAVAIAPWILIVAAIAAVIAILVILFFKWDAFHDFVIDLWEDTKKLATEVGAFFEGLWTSISGFFSNLGGLASSIKDSIGGGITKGLDAVTGAAESAGSAIGNAWDASTGFVGSLAGTAGGAISGAFGSALGAVSGIPGQVGGAFAALPGIMADVASDSITAFVEIFSDLPRKIGFIIGFVAGRMLRIWAQVHRGIIRWTVKIIKTIVDWALKVAVKLAELWWKIHDKIVEIGNKIIDKVVEWGVKLAAKMFEAGQKAFNALGLFVRRLPGMILNALTQMINWLIEKIPVFVGKAWELGFGFVETVLEFIASLPGRFIDFLVFLLTDVTQWVLDMIAQALELGSKFVSGIMDFITGLPGEVLGILNDVIDVFLGVIEKGFNAAKDFGAGLWEGFKEGLFGSPKTKIEYALLDMEDQADETYRNLSRSIRSMNSMNLGVTSGINSGALGIASPAGAGGNNPSVYNQNAPLIGVAHIRSDQDIVSLARELDNQKAKRARSRGVKVANGF